MSKRAYVTVLVLALAAVGLLVVNSVRDRSGTEGPVRTETEGPTPTAKEPESSPKEPGLARLKDVKGGAGFGEARRTYENQTFTLSVFVGGLPKPSSGTSYAAWLEGAGAPLYAGKFSPHKSGELEGWALGHQVKEDLTSYAKLFVAVQAGESQTPGQRLLEGEFGR